MENVAKHAIKAMNDKLTSENFTDSIDADTMLGKIEKARIFSVEAIEGGLFVLEERCDDYFNLTLTPAQLYQLGTELRGLALLAM